MMLDADAHLSGNRTCEIGLHHTTGRAYESVINQLERASRPRPGPPAPARR